MAPEDIHEGILPKINFRLPFEQPPPLTKKRGMTGTEEGLLPAPKKSRPNMVLGEEDLVPRQWKISVPSRSKNIEFLVPE